MFVRVRPLAVAALTAAGLLAAAGPAAAGALDGSLNSPHVLDHIAILNTNINSDPQVGENNNANTSADGKLNNSLGQTCSSINGTVGMQQIGAPDADVSARGC